MNGIEVRLTEVELEKCRQFAKLSAWTQQGIEFGQRDTSDRGIRETARDTLIGKVAEVAVAKHLRGYGVNSPVNFEIYGDFAGDDYDIRIFKWDVDIKATERGKWLMIEHDRLIKRKRQRFNMLPDALAFCHTEMNGNDATGLVVINGLITLPKYLEKARQLQKGDCIPNTSARLQADNYAVEQGDLLNDWKTIVDYCSRNYPPSKGAINIPWSEK